MVAFLLLPTLPIFFCASSSGMKMKVLAFAVDYLCLRRFFLVSVDDNDTRDTAVTETLEAENVDIGLGITEQL